MTWSPVHRDRSDCLTTVASVKVDYATPGPLTRLDAIASAALTTVAVEPVDICSPVHALVIQPTDPDAAHLPEQRRAENHIRPAGELLVRLLALDPAPLDTVRTSDKRIVGTCRHFAVISCALLRHRGIAARVRCGFATYFQSGRGVDHWVTEYREGTGRWVRLDSEVLGTAVIDRPEDLTPEQFLTGGEAWLAFRRGDLDASRFGVHGTANWGPSEISGNAVKDLAALNKVEMLPWDEWGRMTDAYDGKTGADYDDLIDQLSDVCGGDDPDAVAELYNHSDLRVPAHMIS